MEGRITNNSSRDIKRKLEVIQKKCFELNELNVPIGVVYSIQKSNGITVLGDPRITVIERHEEEILQSPEWLDGEDYSYKSAVILAPLPSSLNGTTMKGIIRGILKQLNLKWSSPKVKDDMESIEEMQPLPKRRCKIRIQLYL